MARSDSQLVCARRSECVSERMREGVRVCVGVQECVCVRERWAARGRVAAAGTWQVLIGREVPEQVPNLQYSRTSRLGGPLAPTCPWLGPFCAQSHYTAVHGPGPQRRRRVRPPAISYVIYIHIYTWSHYAVLILRGSACPTPWAPLEYP